MPSAAASSTSLAGLSASTPRKYLHDRSSSSRDKGYSLLGPGQHAGGGSAGRPDSTDAAVLGLPLLAGVGSEVAELLPDCELAAPEPHSIFNVTPLRVYER
jgi:hypothetical protein